MSDQTNKSVSCPNCQKSVAWSEDNKFRPFCSERCKLIDFGEWATEKHTIAGQSLYPTIDDDSEQLQ